MPGIARHRDNEAKRAHAPKQPEVGTRADKIAKHVQNNATRLIPARNHAYVQGDPKSQVYIVESGALTIYTVQSDGRRQVVDFAVPGDILGITSAAFHETSAQATVNTRVRCIPFRTLLALARSTPELGFELYEALSDELVATRQHLATVGQRSSVQRLATFLIALSMRERQRGGSGTQIAIPMKRADIADFLGLTIETVSRAFTKLKLNNLIQIGANQSVTVLDLEALEELCHEAEPSNA